ncbi:MAG: hypothetical protein C0507_04045 [Cyanobacteria bacterium PR.3.49]|nr:hypothetical protein [Cyanobacteria bacterium PR.3.49]
MFEIAEEDRKYLRDDHHRYRVHGISFYSGLAMVMCVFNYAIAYYCFAQSEISEQIASVAFLGTMVLLPLAIVWQFIPCHCGNVRIYSHKGILQNRERDKVTVPKILGLVCTLSVFGAIGSVSLFFFREAYGTIAARGFAIAMPTTVLFGLMLYARFAPRLFKIMQKKEVERILLLRGDSAAELNELIDFYSYVGDFAKSDEYSKNLVHDAENG